MRQLRKAEPFRTFTPHPADGRDAAVNHREFLAMPASGCPAVADQPDDSFDSVDPLLVTDPEVNSNGNVRQGRTKRS